HRPGSGGPPPQVAAMLAPKFPAVATMLADAKEDLTAFASFPPAPWAKVWSTDESFKARVALLGGSGVVRLSVGRGRPRSQEQGGGAGSPAAQLCPLRASTSRPSGGGQAPSEPGIISGWALGPGGVR